MSPENRPWRAMSKNRPIYVWPIAAKDEVVRMRDQRLVDAKKRPGIVVEDDVLTPLFEAQYSGRITDRELARKLNRQPHAVMNWRLGKQKPSLEAVKKLAKVLGYRLTLEKIDAKDR